MQKIRRYLLLISITMAMQACDSRPDPNPRTDSDEDLSFDEPAATGEHYSGSSSSAPEGSYAPPYGSQDENPSYDIDDNYTVSSMPENRDAETRNTAPVIYQPKNSTIRSASVPVPPKKKGGDLLVTLPPDGGDPTDVPIDGGLSLFLAVGIGAGIIKAYRAKKKPAQEKETGNESSC